VRTATTLAIGDDELAALVLRSVPHPLLGVIPGELSPWLLPVAWSQDRLWQIERPVRRVEITTLRWHYELPWWRRGRNEWFQIRPAEFILSPHAFAEHSRRVEDADLSHPVRGIQRRGRTIILDGIHRLVRADLLGLDTIDVMYLELEDLWFICKASR
jgi:hypothetical protein